MYPINWTKLYNPLDDEYEDELEESDDNEYSSDNEDPKTSASNIIEEDIDDPKVDSPEPEQSTAPDGGASIDTSKPETVERRRSSVFATVLNVFKGKKDEQGEQETEPNDDIPDAGRSIENKNQ